MLKAHRRLARGLERHLNLQQGRTAITTLVAQN